MNNIIVSISIRKNIVAILIMESGQIKRRIVERIKDDSALESSYAGMIYAFNLALRHVRQYIQENGDNRNICFETSNSTFIKWVDKQYSKEAYQESFIEVLKLLQELPIKYAFSFSQKPMAFNYAIESYCKKESVSGLDLED